MSHEIRTLMNGVVGMAETLLAEPLTADQSDLVHTIRDSGSALLRIINEILNFSKVEASRLELHVELTSLGQLAQSACDAMQPLAEAAGVRLDRRIDPRLPATVLADDVRVRQILQNLIGNAVKFSGGRTAVAGAVQVSC